MRFCVVKDDCGIYLNFRSDSKEESEVLDKLLRFNWRQELIPVSVNLSFLDGFIETAILHGIGSESEWIVFARSKNVS
jgi:hypothetical protein